MSRIRPEQLAQTGTDEEGWLRRVDANTVEAIKTNLAATTDPGTGDDADAGYRVGSRWINTAFDNEWLCVDATNGGAVWRETTGAGTATPFGKNFEYAESLPTQTETGSAYVQKFRHTTAVLPAGDYFVQMMSECMTSAFLRNGQVRFQEDDVDVLVRDIFSFDESAVALFFGRRSLVAGAHTFDFEIRDDGAGPPGVIAIANMRVTLWRVS